VCSSDLPQHGQREVVVESAEPAVAVTDASQVKQVLLNLVINALEAVEPERGTVKITAGRSHSHCALSVADNGRGMDAQTLDRVFQPFYTQKQSPDTPGLGLGLSISHAIIEQLGGTLTAASPGPGLGSRFTIELPAAPGGTTH